MTWLEVAFAIVKILGMGYALSVLFTLSSNFIFLQKRSVFGWLLSIVIFVFLFWWICYKIQLNVSYPFWATVFVAYKKYPPKLHQFEKVSANAFYLELYGLQNGVWKSRLGYQFFLFTSLVAWVVLYSEVISI